MRKLQNFDLFRRLSPAAIFAITGSLFLFSSNLSAQPEFSPLELRIIKERKYSADISRYRFPQDESQTPDKPFSQSRVFADGNLDPAYNASVTEGFGYVNETVVQPDGKIIAVGIFQRANGTRTNGIARFNADGTIDPSFNTGTGASAVIRTVALQPDGKIIIAGFFTIFNGQTVNRIARLNSNGSMDSSFSTLLGFNNQIEDITLQPDGKILVGGSFTISSSRFVRLNTDGTLETTFTGFTNTVRKIVYLTDGKILVGSDFASASYRRIARINNDGTADATFNPGNGPSGPVFEIAVQPDGKILLGGTFNAYNGIGADAIVRINVDGSLDTAFQIPGVPSSFPLEVDALVAQPDGKFLASYYFQDFPVGFVSRVIRFNSDGTPDATFTPGNGEAPLITDVNLLSDGKFLASGSFIFFNDQPHLRLVKINSDGTPDNTFNPAASVLGIIYAAKRQADGKMVIGGDFDYVNGVRQGGIARLNTDGTLDNSFNTGTGCAGNVYALAIQPDGKIIAGGDYFGFNNNPAFYLSRINSDGSFDMNLYDIKSSISIFFIYALGLQSDGKILYTGSIAGESGSLTAGRLNTNGTPDTTFTSRGLSGGGTVRALLVQPDDKIVIGGTFTTSVQVPRNGLAKLNADGTLNSGFNISSGQVYALAQQADGQVIAGGTLLRRHAAGDGAIDATFNAGGAPPNNFVRAVAVQPGRKILIGGHFTTYNGLNAFHIARINNDGSLDSSFDSGGGAAGNVLALALQEDGKIVAGGQFLDFNFIEKFSIVRLQNTVSAIRAPFDFDGDNKTDLSIFRPSVGEWWYLKSSNGGNAAAQFGAGTDAITPGDFTGDGKTDIAFWRPSTGFWFVLRSEDFSFYSFPFGTTGDIPAPGDFDGDGKTDATVFRPSTATWFISRSSDGGATIQQFGQNGDVPVTADYDGDGKSDIAIYRVALGEWWIQRSAAGTIAFQFGNSSDKPVQGEYTGDGKSDVGIWRPSTGEWFILRSEDQSYYSFPFGTNGDSPAPGDYDGDGKFDAAVFRPSNSTWYIQRTTAGILIQTFGIAGDRAVPNAFVP
jgi:uncharacterized delta-60 repeat protein